MDKKSDSNHSSNPFKRGAHEHAGAALSTSGSYEVMGHGVSHDTYAKRLAALDAGLPDPANPTPAITSDNYQKIYAQEQAAEKLSAETNAHKRQEQFQKANSKKAQQAEEEKRRADAFRARARDLQGQVSSWKQKLGQSPENDRYVQANIESLMAELRGIPSGYWG